ncbi:GDSL esterase/lipase At3g27950 isoform X2 [Amborella trichopoda]|uniref:Uncharacterized protein n=1 Tax=Amborella trichopoda TaxID=13333 RepID=W1PZM2_AMBTC|nr:GDSL esterase/lipase At3g27950 isoform X2 [Amborella trichopoda]ERN13853.1 hypothetical protein AMTR_s00049p00231360 [Amborella trichopoda]|eukprot:XP_020527623.1 GDSL esterase/lipase At3g27950 isoform X2 [Amborella trichopoda]
MILIWWVLIMGLGWNGEGRMVIMGLAAKCEFPAIFNFGDSNSDTGAISAAFQEVQFPNGETFFGEAAGRLCDGRLIVDFIAEKLKVAYVNAYLDSVGSRFKHGANFATSASTIHTYNNTSFPRGGFSPFSLGIQLNQFTQFKSRSNRLYHHENPLRMHFPGPDDFSRALYTFDIGQNDLNVAFAIKSDDQAKAFISGIIGEFTQAIQYLYEQGARAFWIHNTGPAGCLPSSVINYPLKPHNLDKYGCVQPKNEVAHEFNSQLKRAVSQIRKQLPLAALTYVDVYSAKYTLITQAKELGFVDPFVFCCGLAGNINIGCGRKAIINGTQVIGGSCADPLSHVSWDGVHYTHAANRWISNHILNGHYSDPPIPITEACYN